VQRLAEHHGLRLDPADAPANDAEAVDHRRVRVGAHERVGVRQGLIPVGHVEHDAGEVLEVHLVDDANTGRHDPERTEGLLAHLRNS